MHDKAGPLAVALLLGTAIQAQWLNYPDPGIPRLPDGKPNLSATTPRSNGKPDLSGVWSGPGAGSYDRNIARDLKPGDVQPWAEKIYQQRVLAMGADAPRANCLPDPFLYYHIVDLARIVQTPGLTVILYQGTTNSVHRTVFTDGRPLPKNANPTWMGYSIGHWDGDTMVVETAGFNDRGWLDIEGHPHTEALHITERFRRRDFGHMSLEMTIDDPNTFTRPFSIKMEKTLVPDTDLLESICESDHSIPHMVGGEGILTMAPAALSKYTGTYEYPEGRPAVITMEGDLLFLQEGANPLKLPLAAHTDTVFVSRTNGDLIEFQKDARGAVTEFTFHDQRARFANNNMKVPLGLLAFAGLSAAQNYTAQKTTDHGVAIVRLTDAANGVEVSIAPPIGNRAYEMKVHGKNILYFASSDIGELQKKPDLNGVPFLAPWANRLDEQAFWANGKKYTFNMTLGNVRGALPIHGLLSASPLWEVTEVAADKESAHVTSRLQFWKYPDLMAQWPFAHEYEMTYRLSAGVLEVRVTVTNLSSESMPVVLGFHPYYRIPGLPRDQWIANFPARKMVVADDRLIPTGELKPFDLPNPLPLKDHTLDTGFTDLERDAEGRAHFSIEAGGMKVETMFGPKYPVAVVWEPPPLPGDPRDFICFEPMTGITSAVNLQHEGKYNALQTVGPGAKWTESFWIRASGI